METENVTIELMLVLNAERLLAVKVSVHAVVMVMALKR